MSRLSSESRRTFASATIFGVRGAFVDLARIFVFYRIWTPCCAPLALSRAHLLQDSLHVFLGKSYLDHVLIGIIEAICHVSNALFVAAGSHLPNSNAFVEAVLVNFVSMSFIQQES